MPKKPTKRWAVEIKSASSQGFRFFPHWTVLRRFHRERDARKSYEASVRSHGSRLFLYRLVGP